MNVLRMWWRETQNERRSSGLNQIILFRVCTNSVFSCSSIVLSCVFFRLLDFLVCWLIKHLKWMFEIWMGFSLLLDSIFNAYGNQ